LTRAACDDSAAHGTGIIIKLGASLNAAEQENIVKGAAWAGSR
jgi:hypothetical protein